MPGRATIGSWAALLAILGAAGCTTYSEPKLNVAGVRVTGSTPDGVALEFTLDVQNRNATELPLRELRYSVWLDGKRVFSGVRSPEASLRRFGTQRILAPAAFSRAAEAGVPDGPAECRIEGTLRYVTPGKFAEILFDVGADRPTVDFKGQATVDLSAGPTKTDG